MLAEIWKSVKGFEGFYEVSNLGKVKSLEREVRHARWGESMTRKTKERILKPSKSNCGYFRVGLWKNGKMKSFLVHRLVALAFIPNPENKKCINHKDGVKTNNNTPNLEWATYSENTRHAFKNGLRNNNYSEKKVIQFSKSGKVVRVWKSLAEAGRGLEIHKSGISVCCRGEKYHHTAGGFRWEYF